MTEPQGGSDPSLFETKAVRDGDEWVINGWKFFSSNARTASFLIVMALTDTDTDVYHGMSMFLVPADTPGVKIVRNIGLMGERVPGSGMHALIHYDDVRVPAESLLGGEGQAFAIAQTRLGGGRVHHAMRTVGMAGKVLDMLGERAVSRKTRDGLPLRQAERARVRGRLLHPADPVPVVRDVRRVVHRPGADPKGIRQDIAAIKVLTPQVIHDITQRAIQVHGALGVSDELPLASAWTASVVMGLVDGPTEVHRETVARQVLKRYQPVEGLWPSQHLPTRIVAGPGQVRRPPRRAEERRRARSWRQPSSTRWATGEHGRGRGRRATLSDRRGAPRSSGWTSEGLPGEGEPMTVRFITGGASNDLFEITRGGQRFALRRPPEPIPRAGTRPCSASSVCSRRCATPTCRTPAWSRGATTPSVLGGCFYLMEFVDGWSPIQEGTTWPEPFGSDLEARRGLAFELVEGIARLSKVDWQGQGSRGVRPARRVPRAPGRPLALASRCGAVPPASRHRRGGRVAAGPQAAHLPARHHARRLPVRQRDVPPRCARPAGGHRRLGDGDRRGPAARPRMGDQRLARRPLAPRRGDGQLRGLHRHALGGRAARLLRRIGAGARSTRSTTTSSSPGSSWPSCSKPGTRGSSPARPTTRRWRPSATWCSRWRAKAAELAATTDLR